MKQNKPHDHFRFISLWALAGACELPILLNLFCKTTSMGPALSLVGHLAAAALLYAAPPKHGGWFSKMRPWGEPMALWTFIFPGWGWIIMGALWFTHLTNPSSAKFLWDDDPLDEAPGEARISHDDSWELQKKIRGGGDIMPAVDILLGSSAELKRGAISTLAKIRSADSIAWILKSRSDSHPEVRFYATSTLTMLRRDYEQAIKAAQQERLDKPIDAQTHLDLFRIQYEYAVSGLVDENQKLQNLAQCEVGLLEASQENDQALRLLLDVQKILHPQNTMPTIKKLSLRFPEEDVTWLKERILLLFKLKQFDQVREEMAVLKNIIDHQEEATTPSAQDLDWKTAVLWWSHD